jgi:hypothetical protein
MSRAFYSLALTLVVGCGEGPASQVLTETRGEGAKAVSQTLAVPGSADVADTKCNIVLREAHRPSNGMGGYEVDYATGGFYVWAGSIDVAVGAQADLAGVGLYYTSATGEWFQADATAVDGAPKGFARYAFRLNRNTVRDGMSMTSLMRTHIELVPYLVTTSGARRFDHNRNADPLANYVLVAANAWTVKDDAAVCPGVRESKATLDFLSAGKTEARGALVAGGTLTVSYALDRLPNCRATHNGYPAWGTTAFARFMPGGQVREARVNAFVSDFGRPTNVAYSVPAEFTIPSDAKTAELWFQNSSGAGNFCDTWDSNYGANYRYEVLATPPAAVVWAGDWGGSFSRECSHEFGLSEPVRLDSYVRERACSFVDADVYVPGVTESGAHPERIFAEVEYRIDGGEPARAWLSNVGKVGNNLRYRWALPRAEMNAVPWNAYSYTFRFSTDGTHWYVIGQDVGPEAANPRTVVRDASWCSSGWPGCP